MGLRVNFKTVIFVIFVCYYLMDASRTDQNVFANYQKRSIPKNQLSTQYYMIQSLLQNVNFEL